MDGWRPRFSEVIPAFLDAPGARRIFRRVSLDIDLSTNEPCEAPTRRERLTTDDQAREALLQIALAKISEAEPSRLRAIIANAEMSRDLAWMRNGAADATIYEMIRQRATTRLRWFKRQEAKA